MAKKLRSEQVDLANYYNKTESTPLIQGSNITITETEEGVVISSSGGGGGGSTDWADITDKPATFAPSAHTHSATDIASGTLDIARIPTGTTASTVSLGNHTHTVANITGLESTLTGLENSVDNASILVAGNNITLTPSGNNLTISASGGGGGGSVAWGDVTDKPASFVPSAHNHAAGEITSGTLDIGRIPTGTTASTVSLGNHSHDEIDNATDLTAIAGYNGTVKQYLTHDASGVLSWENA